MRRVAPTELASGWGVPWGWWGSLCARGTDGALQTPDLVPDLGFLLQRRLQDAATLPGDGDLAAAVEFASAIGGSIGPLAAVISGAGAVVGVASAVRHLIRRLHDKSPLDELRMRRALNEPWSGPIETLVE